MTKTIQPTNTAATKQDRCQLQQVAASAASKVWTNSQDSLQSKELGLSWWAE